MALEVPFLGEMLVTSLTLQVDRGLRQLWPGAGHMVPFKVALIAERRVA